MIDGFPVRYLDEYNTPNLNRLATSGVRAEAVTSVFPAKSLPNQYTIVTGLYPDNHGVISNVMQHDNRRFSLIDKSEYTDPFWWGGEPIWITASKQGKKTFTYFWPGSETRDMHPAKWYPYDRTTSEIARTNKAIEWIKRPSFLRPNLVTIYFDSVDLSGHTFGPASKQVEMAVEATDFQIGRLLDALEGIETNIIVMSDHGHVDTDPEKYIFLENYINPEEFTIIELSPYLMANADSSENIYSALKEAHPALSVYHKPDFPEQWHWGRHVRTPDIVATLKTGWSLYVSRAQLAEEPGDAGTHGYDDSSESLEGLFIAYGPAFKQSISFPPFSNIHVYELLAYLMQVAPAPNDGNLETISGMLR